MTRELVEESVFAVGADGVLVFRGVVLDHAGGVVLAVESRLDLHMFTVCLSKSESVKANRVWCSVSTVTETRMK